ncbi:NUDIX hydrolase [Pseudorhodoferax sp.]|uniref:NUDIX hydrolase n=1 Tax=Pseudorhodoferax sp. TaxID=1993553 RepID=UPI002DD6963E|nr:NUDIX domain-containing protein [Pseudorhodoferax sp.]
MTPDWPAIAAAHRQPTARRPWALNGVPVGSVAEADVQALQACAPELQVHPEGLALALPHDRVDTVLARINAALRARGLIHAWRDETFPLFGPPAGAGTAQPVLARIERASARFWGTLTLGAHCTGWVAGADGRPAALWIAQRAFDKATDPGKFDNLVGGGVPLGQSPWQALQREGWEEAGLPAAVMQRATPGRVLRLHRDVEEGLQHEWNHSYDLQLQAHERPHNQDGEVAGFELLPVVQAVALAAGEQMTVDAALVTLDFVLRHRLLPEDECRRLEARCTALWVPEAPNEALGGPAAATDARRR